MANLRLAPNVQLSVSVVLHHSNLEFLRLTLASLAHAAQVADVNPHLVVVDQSLNADYARAAQVVFNESWPFSTDAQFLVAGDNGGYGAGHNRALSTCLGRYHLVLNPDVVLDPQALMQGLASLSQDESIVLVAPRSLDERGQEEFLAKAMPSVAVLALRAFGPEWLKRRYARALNRYECRDLPREGLPHVITLASGCCMLIRGTALCQVSGFSDAFFLYFEDYDLSLRLTQYGRVCRDPHMRIRHFGGEAARKGVQHIIWFVFSGVRFFNRWGWRFSG